MTVLTTTSWIKVQLNDIKTTLDIFYAFLALSVIVSLFGMVNTLVLSVSNGRAKSGCFGRSVSAAGSCGG